MQASTLRCADRLCHFSSAVLQAVWVDGVEYWTLDSIRARGQTVILSKVWLDQQIMLAFHFV